MRVEFYPRTCTTDFRTHFQQREVVSAAAAAALQTEILKGVSRLKGRTTNGGTSGQKWLCSKRYSNETKIIHIKCDRDTGGGVTLVTVSKIKR